MYSKISIILLIGVSILTASCSAFKSIVHKPNINQGNYLKSNDIVKIQKGMTQEQIINILGTPILHDPFGSQVWFYVSRQESDHKGIIQQTVTLTFNNSNILTEIQNQTNLVTHDKHGNT